MGYFLLLILGVFFLVLGIIGGQRGNSMSAVKAAAAAVLFFAGSFLMLFTDAPKVMLNIETMPQNGGFLMMFGLLGYCFWCAACSLSGYASSKFIFR